MRHSMSKGTAFNAETTPRHTLLCSDSQCLPPGDPRILCAKHGYPITGKSFIGQINVFLFSCVKYAQYKLPVQITSNRSSFLAAFFPKICCLVMQARRNEFESKWGQKLTVLVTYSTSLLYEPKAHFCKRGGFVP